MSCLTCAQHSLILFRKSIRISYRNWVSILASVVVPVGLFLLFGWIRSALDVDLVEKQSFAPLAVTETYLTCDTETTSFFPLSFTKVVFTPDVPEVRALGESFLQLYGDCWNQTIDYFPTRQAMETNYLDFNEENASGYLGIEFESYGADGWQLMMRDNWLNLPSQTGQPNTYDVVEDEYNTNPSFYFAAPGVGGLLIMVYKAIFNLQGLDWPDQIAHAPFPIAEHYQDGLLQLLDYFPILFPLAFLVPLSRIIRNIVLEKEARLKEGMRIMGLHGLAFWGSWYLFYTSFFTIIALISTLCSTLTWLISDVSLVFVLYWLFLLSSMSFNFVLSTLIDQSKRSGIAGNLSVVVTLVPYFVINSNDYPRSAWMAGALMPGSAMAWAVQDLVRYESWQVGLKWSNYMISVNNIAAADCINMLLCSILVYTILLFYFDNVLPRQHGTPLAPWFCFLQSYWKPRDPSVGSKLNGEDMTLSLLDEESKSDDLTSQTFQLYKPDPDTTPTIRIRKLRKEFGQFVAVDGLDLDVYKGELFCLLGHNGAGKTTTINMLTGMLPITSGSATISGYNCATEMTQIRDNLGVCPQHDVLFPKLTVAEHLHMYGQFKGMQLDEREECITDMLQIVGLTNKRDSNSSDLSGGMKRKLSVCISLIGNSDVVFLDEPSSGVDADSRRGLWNLLKKYKSGKAIVFTTHFMDEADNLSDRIAIMSHGSIQCCGTALYLKRLYGLGYNIVITRDFQRPGNEPGEKSDEKLDEKYDEEVRALTNQIETLVVTHVPDAKQLSDVGTEISFQLPIASSSKFPAMLTAIDNNKESLRVASYGISVTSLEEVFLAVGKGAYSKQVDNSDSLTRSMTMTKQRAEELTALCDQGEDTSELYRFGKHFSALFWKRFNNAKRDISGMWCQLAFPVMILALGLAFLQWDPQMEFVIVDYTTSVYNQPLPVPVNNDQESFFQNLPSSYMLEPDLPFTLTSDNFLATYLAYWIDPPYRFTPNDDWLYDNRNDHAESRYGSFVYDPNSTYFFLQYNVTGMHALPSFYTEFVNALYQSQVPDSPEIGIQASVQAWPYDRDARQVLTVINGVFVAIIVAVAFAFIPASYGAIVIKEREIGAKHIQMISGVSEVAYWSATYAWDIVNYLAPSSLCILTILLFQTDSLTGENMDVVVTVIFLYGPAICSFTYLLTFLFNSHSSGQTYLIILYILSGMLLPIVSFVLDLIPSTKDTNEVLIPFYRLLPNYCLGDTLVRLTIGELIASFSPEPFDRWSSDTSMGNVVALMWTAPVYFALTLVLERVGNTPAIMAKCCQGPTPPVETFDDEDRDVVAERERVRSGGAADDMIRLEGVRKVYSAAEPVVAVHDLYFGIPRGQCFGFLGINGAGKTTTLSILSGAKYPTAGNAFLGNHSILTEQQTTRQLIGYCPQFDALIGNLTARENLELFARIKLVAEARVPSLVNGLIEAMSLSMYADKPCKTYSGGNKRKLSVAMSLIGNPSVVFLDEPSTGMDPVSRRHMWDFISATMAGRSVILTTHSMEECEALCSNVGIMVDGRLRCLGSTQHLKNRYSTGYQLDINGPAGLHAIQSFVLQHFPKAMLLEAQDHKISFTIPLTHKLAHIFQVMEAADIELTEYSVAQMSLEQIFIQLARGKKDGGDNFKSDVHVKMSD